MFAARPEEKKGEMLSVVQIQTQIANQKREIRELEVRLKPIDEEVKEAEKDYDFFKSVAEVKYGEILREVKSRQEPFLTRINALKNLIVEETDMLPVARAREKAKYRKELVEATKMQTDTTHKLLERLVAPLDPPAYGSPADKPLFEKKDSPALINASSTEAKSSDDLLNVFKKEFNEQLGKKLSGDELNVWNQKIDILALQLKKLGSATVPSRVSARIATVFGAQSRADEYKRQPLQADVPSVEARSVNSLTVGPEWTDNM